MRRIVWFWRWPFLTRRRALGRYLKTTIFSPRSRCGTTSGNSPRGDGRPADLEAFTIGDEEDTIDGDGLAGFDSSRSTSSWVPSSTRYCLPPVSMTAYMESF